MSLVRLGVTGGCLAYLVMVLDWESLVKAFPLVSISGCLWVTLAMVGLMLAMGFRLVGLLNDVSLVGATLSEFLGAGVNNILPAKLGEFAKIIFLKRRYGVSLVRGGEAVVWEKVSDLTMLLLVGGVVSPFLDLPLSLRGIALFAFCCWAGFLSLILSDRWGMLIVRWVPVGRVRGSLLELVDLWKQRRSIAFAVLLLLRTLCVWLFYLLINWLVLVWLADLPLSVWQLLIVFVAGSIGMTLPAGPASIGVFEASMVMALGWFGIALEDGIAATLLLHAAMVAPTVMVAGGIALVDGVSVRNETESGQQMLGE